MKLSHYLLVGLFAGSAVAQAPVVSPELVGTWASADIDCKRPGPSTLIISVSVVTRFNIGGRVIAGDVTSARTIGRRTVEVSFDPGAAGSHPLGVRKFVLSNDGRELLETDGGKIVATRHRCESVAD